MIAIDVTVEISSNIWIYPVSLLWSYIFAPWIANENHAILLLYKNQSLCGGCHLKIVFVLSPNNNLPAAFILSIKCWILYCIYVCVCVCNFIISWNLEVDHPVLFLACFCFFFIIAEYTPVCIVSQCLPMLWSQRTKEENVFSFMFSFGFGEISAPIL